MIENFRKKPLGPLNKISLGTRETASPFLQGVEDVWDHTAEEHDMCFCLHLVPINGQENSGKRNAISFRGNMTNDALHAALSALLKIIEDGLSWEEAPDMKDMN